MTSSDSQTSFLASACDCETNTSYNSTLPSSHPSNRCATQNNDVSWTNWLSGNSRSSQFHFIDLLELIHGHKQKPLPELPGSQVTQ
ncbi:hypothetical protein ACFOD0_09285 [Shewanella intestini]|nr:hypothetical protein [Shewanella sp. XMDDZSB0408]